MEDGQFGNIVQCYCMRVLVAGCGSAGKRHIKNLIALQEIEKVFIYTNIDDCLNNFSNKEKLERVNSLEKIDVDFAVIANETYKHIDTAIVLGKQGIHLFIEKPVSHNFNNIDLLMEIIKNNKLKTCIGYNLRFLGIVQFIKRLLNEKAFGNIYFAKIEVGKYLPLWRQGINYKGSYSIHKYKGGGVSLDLSHEIDYMRYLFGDPSSWNIMATKIGDVTIDSDDLFEGIFLYSSGFICNVHMDYLQVNPKRELRIAGSKGLLTCDFINKKMTIRENDKGMESIFNDTAMFNMDATYCDELVHFMDSIRHDFEPCITLEDGIGTLKLLQNEYKNV